MSRFIVVLITISSEDAGATLAKALVSEKQCACVNIIPSIRSVYEWNGEMCEDKEALLIVKTTADKSAALIKRVKELHSYQTPEIICLPVSDGSDDYLDWVSRCVNPPSSDNKN